jgi:DNA-binding XRE family transcriptional regulator
MDISDIPARVRYALKQGETPAGLAKKAGLHRNTLYGCDTERWNPTLDTLNRLAPHLPKIEAAPKQAAA